MNRFTICFAYGLVAISLQARGDDTIQATLEMAKVEYELRISDYQRLANDYFDEREDAARKQGNKKQVDQIKSAREAFDNFGYAPLGSAKHAVAVDAHRSA